MNTIKFGITTYLKSFNIAIKVHIIYIKSKEEIVKEIHSYINII